MTKGQIEDPQERGLEAVLIVVAFHPGPAEVDRLSACLGTLPAEIGYAVVANDYSLGEEVEALEPGSLLFLRNRSNPGYGRAINQAVASLREMGIQPPFLGALNTDLAWKPYTFETLLEAMRKDPLLMLAVPQLLDPQGSVQHLCKRNPTVLGLFSRRFLPERLKPRWLRNYDSFYAMENLDYQAPFAATYLSGCCMVMRRGAFEAVGGFDERFFLYLEDADLTRSLARLGRTMHRPEAEVVHHWGRGNHRSLRLTIVNLQSAYLYFSKWGWQLW